MYLGIGPLVCINNLPITPVGNVLMRLGYQGIISIVASYNCWTESPYIYPEGASVQVLQIGASGFIIMISDTKDRAKFGDFLSKI